MKIVLCALVGFLLIGCSDDNSGQDRVVEQSIIKEQSQAQEVAQDAALKDAAVEQDVALEQEATQDAELGNAVVEPDIGQDAELGDAVVEPDIGQDAVVEPEVVESESAIKDGAELYKSCAACHGADGSKAALGKSEIIKGSSAQKIADALNGYKDGTFGGAMKGLMNGQVKNLTSQEIEILSEYIADF